MQANLQHQYAEIREGASLIHESGLVEKDLREERNIMKTRNQLLWKETEDFESVKQEHDTLKKQLEIVEKKAAKLGFQITCHKKHIACLQEEIKLRAVKKQHKDSEPAPAAAKESFPYSPFLATFAVAAVAFFMGRR